MASGLRALVDKPYLLTDRHQEQQWQAITEGAHPDIVEFTRVFIARMGKVHGVPLFPHNMVRTVTEQNALFVRGVTKARGGSSPHNFGCAVDIVHSRKAWDLERESWAMLGHIGKEIATQKGIRLTWGGDWEFYDPAHWELTGWRDIRPRLPVSDESGKFLGHSGFPEWYGVRAWVNGSRVPFPKSDRRKA